MLRTITQKVALAALICLLVLVIAVAITLSSILVLRDSAAHLAETTATRTKVMRDFRVAMTRAAIQAPRQSSFRQRARYRFHRCNRT